MALSNFALIFFFIEIILYFFHLSLLVLMIAERKKTFNGPFFNIFRTTVIADFSIFIFMLYQKLALIPLVKEYLANNSYTATGLYGIVSSLGAVQFFGHSFLALNRFTMIWFPLQQSNVWKRQWYTVIILGVPFLSVSWRFLESAYFVFISDGVISVIYTSKNVMNLTYVVSTSIYFSTTIFAAVFNILSFTKFFIRKKNNSLLNVNERNLLFVSLISFIAQLLKVSSPAVKFFFPSYVELLNFLSEIYPIINGIFAWSGSISLLFLSSSTRKAYLSFYFCKPKLQQFSSTPQQKLFTMSTTTRQ